MTFSPVYTNSYHIKQCSHIYKYYLLLPICYPIDMLLNFWFSVILLTISNANCLCMHTQVYHSKAVPSHGGSQPHLIMVSCAPWVYIANSISIFSSVLTQLALDVPYTSQRTGNPPKNSFFPCGTQAPHNTWFHPSQYPTSIGSAIFVGIMVVINKYWYIILVLRCWQTTAKQSQYQKTTVVSAICWLATRVATWNFLMRVPEDVVGWLGWGVTGVLGVRLGVSEV